MEAVITAVVVIIAAVEEEVADPFIPANLFRIQEDLDIMIGMAGKGIFIAVKRLKK